MASVRDLADTRQLPVGEGFPTARDARGFVSFPFYGFLGFLRSVYFMYLLQLKFMLARTQSLYAAIAYGVAHQKGRCNPLRSDGFVVEPRQLCSARSRRYFVRCIRLVSQSRVVSELSTIARFILSHASNSRDRYLGSAMVRSLRITGFNNFLYATHAHLRQRKEGPKSLGQEKLE